MPTTILKNGTILRDWTKMTIVIDVENSMGETYHFEIEPEADSNSVPTRPLDKDTNMNMLIPIGTPKEK